MMKKGLQTAFCALGSGMIGFFADQLETAGGIAGFSIGVLMLTVSIGIVSDIGRKKK